jgi:hypothetical protein
MLNSPNWPNWPNPSIVRGFVLRGIRGVRGIRGIRGVRGVRVIRPFRVKLLLFGPFGVRHSWCGLRMPNDEC